MPTASWKTPYGIGLKRRRSGIRCQRRIKNCFGYAGTTSSRRMLQRRSAWRHKALLQSAYSGSDTRLSITRTNDSVSENQKKSEHGEQTLVGNGRRLFCCSENILFSAGIICCTDLVIRCKGSLAHLYYSPLGNNISSMPYWHIVITTATIMYNCSRF